VFKKTTIEGEKATAASNEIGLLGLDSRFKGEVRFVGTLTLDGSISGTVTAPEGSGAVLIVNAQAAVDGDITADSVLISGKITGNIKARERVEIFATGTLHGDIETADIMIEGGAEFQGRCHMLRPEPAAGNGARRVAEGRGNVAPLASGGAIAPKPGPG
jgi:cytoskeletal protein CcmA (bactofilin family)